MDANACGEKKTHSLKQTNTATGHTVGVQGKWDLPFMTFFGTRCLIKVTRPTDKFYPMGSQEPLMVKGLSHI